MSQPLEISELSVGFTGPRGEARILDRITLSVAPGRIVGLVGESGSGKTVLSKSVLGLLAPNARLRGGRIRYGTTDILSEGKLRKSALRGREIAMIFQNPKASLNPIRKIGQQIEDVIRRHEKLSRRDRRSRALSALRDVGLPDPERLWHAYPFELSGGMAQRALIAVALGCNPGLLIADEPTSGLDASLRRSIMELIRKLSRERGMSVLLVTHDLAIAEAFCDRLAVMHAGHIVEQGNAAEVVRRPAHPYTAALLRSTPQRIDDLMSLEPIRGTLPDLYGSVPSCRFLARCEHSCADCEDPAPILPAAVAPDHPVLCRRPL